MSNIKQVTAIAVIPFNWMEDMEEPDKGFLASLFLAPSIGLSMTFHDLQEFRDNEHGGKTAMYEVDIQGMEAISFPMLDRLKALLERYGEVKLWEAFDWEAMQEAHQSLGL